MPNKNTGKRGANGAGSIRKRTTVKNGKEYVYWEARYTIGFDERGRQMQRTITGKTQKEVSQKLKTVTLSIDNGTYIPPDKRTVAQWMNIWTDTYLGNVKPRTQEIYQREIRVHINPELGDIALQSLKPERVQQFYNKLQKEDGLSPKTVKCIHGILHGALKQAVLNGNIPRNPTESCVLPDAVRAEIKPLKNDEVKAFFQEAEKDTYFYPLMIVTLLTGMREGEVMGLTWDCVDFEHGCITINKQLFRFREKDGGTYRLVPTKNGKARSVVPAKLAMDLLEQQRKVQAELEVLMGAEWSNPDNLVFTDENGRHLTNSRVYRRFKRIATKIGRSDARFHDLRHSFAVLSLQAGDDMKTLQGNLGHATASFTMDVYGHVTDDMKKASSNRMNNFLGKMDL